MPSLPDYEKLGVFYLGRVAAENDPGPGTAYLYESRRLVTHGLIVGMTGSGKTGLGIDLIEEAALDGIPSLVVDPKGDLSNLLLTFPELRPADFEPWVSEEEARAQGISRTALAERQAAAWKQGLAEWDQTGERIARLREAAEFSIYTPGGTAARPLSILRSFAAPPPAVLEEPELVQARIASTVSGLLGLLGITADPLRSREATLLGQILAQAWREGRELDLAGLIQAVQTPPFTQVGVLDLESFYPSRERFELVLQLNNLLASPAFAGWREGDPLDVGQLLYSETGRPRVAVLSIAHLNDAERMFFVTLLLNEVLGWMRSQSGTGSLRALLYMDEIAGYFPPVAMPPSKQPLLTLLKQARAFGLGVVLSTQNPVDLDYKGLANIGSWFIGRLQTDRDRARLIDGLEGAASARGVGFDRGAAERLVSGLGKRTFLLHTVHDDEPVLFTTRWTLSYLAGPLDRSRLKQLASRRTPSAVAQPVASRPVPTAAGPAPPSAPSATAGVPVLPPAVPRCYLPIRAVAAAAAGGQVYYEPRLLGIAQVRYRDVRTRRDFMQEVGLLAEVTEGPLEVDWSQAEELAGPLEPKSDPPVPGDYGEVPAAAAVAKNYGGWTRAFVQHLAANRRLKLLTAPALGLAAEAGEDEREFRIRVQQAGREQRDAAAERLRAKYAPKLAALNERLRRAAATEDRERQQATRAKMDTVFSFGATVLGAFLGRKTISSTTVGRAATAMRSAGRAYEQSTDVGRAADTVEALRGQLDALDAEFKAEVEKLGAEFDPERQVESVELTASKANVVVRWVALAWAPVVRSGRGEVIAAYRA